jgi:ubiquinone/menaquinone biosynthesis C-methylase UbiE
MRIEKTVSFYDTRFKKLGPIIQSVGWSNKTDQYKRFDLLFNNSDLAGKSILDVGCGLGDLVEYLETRGIRDYVYTGIDISREFINFAELKYGNHNASFHVSDVLSINNLSADIVLASGAFSFRQVGMKKYVEKAIKKMFSISNDFCSVNFLSSEADYKLKKNQYYAPTWVLKQALSLSDNVELNYGSPKNEFTVVINK